MNISVIIVNWNTRNLLEQCLESLTSAPASRSTEIIVVDNASSDDSVEMVEKKFPHVKLIRSQENLGFAKANNLAIQRSVGRYVSLVNSDVKVLPGCLDALADYLDRNPKVGNVGPRVLNTDMTLQTSCRYFPTLWNNFCAAAGLSSVFRRSRLFSGEEMNFFAHDRITLVEGLVGCFWMLRRDAIQNVGTLDESFFMYGEDLDWCRRCWNANWQVAFTPAALAIHHRGGSSHAHITRLAVTQQNSVLHYWSKHKSPLELLGIKSIFLFRHLIRYSLGLILRLVRPADVSRSEGRARTSWACMQALLSGSAEVPRG
ncbi:MAG: glycosyltransferase family 2 protein [Acidobacteriaceae bacterium]